MRLLPRSTYLSYPNVSARLNLESLWIESRKPILFLGCLRGRVLNNELRKN